MPPPQDRSLLDTVRWASALMVCVGHVWGLTVIWDFSYLGKLVQASPHSAVVLFFVISGYLVGGGALREHLAGTFEFRRYAISRFARIYIVLIPAILLTLALDGLAWTIDPTSPIYASSQENPMGEVPPFERYGLGNIIASLFCLEGFAGLSMGSNFPLWSLGFEWVFYFTGPAVLLASDAVAARIGRPVWLCRVAGVLCVATLLVASHKFYLSLLWLIWNSSAFVRIAAERGWGPERWRWLGLPVCAFGFLIAPIIGYRLADPFIGFGFAFFLSAYSATERGFHPRFDRFLADRSYSLYVIHLPIAAFLWLILNRAGILAWGGVPAGPAAWGANLLILAVVATVVSLFHWLFESNTAWLRNLLLTRAGLRLRPAAGSA